MQSANDSPNLPTARRSVNPEFLEFQALIRRLVQANLASIPTRSLTDTEIRAVKQHEGYARRNGHRAKRPRGPRRPRQ